MPNPVDDSTIGYRRKQESELADRQVERVDIDRGQDKYLVSLPCEPDLFGEFISKLLGRPQTINRKIQGYFTIDRAGIESLYHVIDQRISSQNGAKPISFAISIHYNDGSSVSLNSYESFLSYNEVKPLIVTGIVLSWIHLIKFSDITAPEKQQIDLWFDTFSYADESPVTLEFDPIGFTSDKRYIRRYRNISYRIQHTNRSWGGDIDNLLAGYLRNYLTPLTGWRAILTDRSVPIALLVFVIMAAGSIYCAYRISDAYNQQLRDKVHEVAVAHGVGFSQVNERLDLLNRLVLYQFDNGIGLGSVGFVFIAIIISGIVAIIVGSSASYPNKSFILINKVSTDRYNDFKVSSGNSIARFIISILFALALGIGGNILYYYLTKYTGFQP